MKTYLQFSIAALLLLALTACAGSSASKDVRVKCPACGYGFDVESKG